MSEKGEVEPAKRGCCNKICCLYCCEITSIILIIVAGLAYVIINPLITAVLTNEFVIDSEEAVRYADWACKFSTSRDGVCLNANEVPFTEAYFMFNLTNYEDVLNGATPRYNETGPYVYQVSITKFNITYLNDGETVAYIEENTYYWRQDLTDAEGCRLENGNTCSPDDLYLGVNTGYLGAVDTVLGAESLLVLGLSGPVINQLFADIEQDYINGYLIAQQGQTEQSILARCGRFDPNCETLRDAAILQWSYFNLTAFGLQGDALNGILPDDFPYEVTEYGGFLFNTRGGPTANLPARLSLTTIKTLMYGPYGVNTDPLNLLELVELAAEARNSTELEQEMIDKYGINNEQFSALTRYILQIRDTYNTDLIKSIIYNLPGGGGLFSLRSVYQWVFDFADPLLKLLQPGDPQTNIRHNDTSFEDAARYKIGMEIYTGKNNIGKIGDVVRWNGTTSVNYWKVPIAVEGNNQDGQFVFTSTSNTGKLPDILPDYVVWSPDHGRTVLLEDSGEWVNTPQGIPTKRFYLANSTYYVNSTFYQDVQGFINASFYHSDPPFRPRLILGASIPLWMCQPRFYDVDPTYANKIILNKAPSTAESATIIDVEPISGNGMFAKKRLQVNFRIGADVNFRQFYPGVQNDIFFPSLWIEQTSLVTDTLADEWLSELGLGLTLEEVFFIAGLTIGSFFFVLCTLLIIRHRSQRSSLYEPINN